MIQKAAGEEAHLSKAYTDVLMLRGTICTKTLKSSDMMWNILNILLHCATISNLCRNQVQW